MNFLANLIYKILASLIFRHKKECFNTEDIYNSLGKEMQKSKMSVWGGLTNSCEIREVKSKGEKERYKHLNAEFQRKARRESLLQ